MTHRVLIVTGGFAPAVVTETVWALAEQRDPPFWPDVVIAVVTADAAKRFAIVPSKIAELATYLRRPSVPQVDVQHIASPDIKSDADAIAFGDKVCGIVKRVTADDNNIVHLSIAGGRKTMSFHGGAAMTLFGRPQDELSHVLVTPPGLEGCPDFWWPTREERRIPHEREQQGGKPRLYNTQVGDGSDLAKVDLALIPFVRARGRLPAALRDQPMDYGRYVAQVNAAIEGTSVVVELLIEESTLSIADGAATVRLQPKDFAVYRVLAGWAKGTVKGAGPNGVGSNHTGWLSTDMIRRPQDHQPNPIAVLNAFSGADDADDQDTFQVDTSDAPDPTTANNAFGQAVARVRKAIDQKVADPVLANRLLCRLPKGDGLPARNGLLLSPHEIMIRAHADGPEVPALPQVARLAGAG